MGITRLVNFTHALANVGGSDPVFFDLPPEPEPIPSYERVLSKKRTLSAYNGSVFLPGRTWFFDGGADISGAELNVQLEDVYPDTYQLILNKFLYGSGSAGSPGIEPVWYSPNNVNTPPAQNWNPTNVFELIWNGYPLLLPKGIGRYAGTLKFCINRQVQ